MRYRYKAVRESDGTYSIRSSRAGLNYSDIVKTGVRGCNASKVIDKLYRKDDEEEIKRLCATEGK